ncbi:MAG: 2Fe-2S iron-sulfur cluster binding domain-containing protein [Gammaproteobacteria bacterium]|nr:2Fe-2S iron-sulfur cluster binding domain-containing protein [Gammaproteobacteria bacterium]
MPRHLVSIENTGEEFLCEESVPVLLAMESAMRHGIPVGCRNGGCGICKVEVLSGEFAARVMSRAHVSLEEQVAGHVLSCRIRPRSALRLRALRTTTRKEV